MIYADVRGKVKTFQNLAKASTKSHITKNGDLIMELKNSPDEVAENFLGKVEKPSGGEMQVRLKSRRL